MRRARVRRLRRSRWGTARCPTRVNRTVSPSRQALPSAASTTPCAGCLGTACPRKPVASADAEEVELAVADFAKGGPVDQVLPFVSTDETRPHINCVLLATDEAVGLDGHALLQRPLAKGPPAPVLVPRQAALAIRRMMDHTEVERLVLRSDTARDWFVATCRDGAEWTVSFKRVDAVYPPYKDVAARVASAEEVFSTTIDAAELRAMVGPLGRCEVAIFADGGLVAWSGRGEGEIAMSLAAYTSDSPITVVGSEKVALVLKGVTAPTLHVDVCGSWKDEGAEIRIDGRVMMPTRVHRETAPTFPDDWSEGIPRWVRERMAVEFGLAESEPAPDRVALHEKLLAEALADENKRDHVPALFETASTMRTAIANLGAETAAAALRQAVVVDRRDGTFLAMPGTKVKPYPYPVLHLGPPTKRDLKAARQTGMLYAVDPLPPPASTQADPAEHAPTPPEAVSAASELLVAAPGAVREPARRASRRRHASAPAPEVRPAAAAPPAVTPDVAAAPAPEPASALRAASAAPPPAPAPTAPLSPAKRAWLTRRAKGWTSQRCAADVATAPAPRAAAAPSPVADGSMLSPAKRAWVTRRAKQAGAGAPAASAPCA